MAADESQAREATLRALADEWDATRCGVTSPGLRRAADELRQHIGGGIVQPPSGQIMGIDHDFAPGGSKDTLLASSPADAPAECGAEHPTNPSVVPCVRDKGHEGSHMSTTGCGGSVAHWNADAIEEAMHAEVRAGQGAS